MSTTVPSSSSGSRGGAPSAAPAPRGARRRWRTVDVVVASVLAVALGVVFWAWSAAFGPASAALGFFPPASALLVGIWLLGGVVGGLVVRRPGAAVYVELVAGLVEALIGNSYGFSSVYYGLLQGLGAELVFALVLYRRWGLPTAVVAGAVSGLASSALDLTVGGVEFAGWLKLAYAACAVVSGAVLAGGLGWALVRALAATGALAPLASGRTATRV